MTSHPLDPPLVSRRLRELGKSPFNADFQDRRQVEVSGTSGQSNLERDASLLRGGYVCWLR